MARNIKTKIQLIQHLINFNRYKSYLEVGVKNRRTFDNITCEQKVGIDPVLIISSEKEKGIDMFKQDSDTFFKENKNTFDIVLVDGLHLYEQAMKDVINSWNCLNLNGAIVIHDCLPKTAVMCSRKRVTREWTGDVWKVIVWFRKGYAKIPCSVINIDYGCGVIIKTTDKKLTIPVGKAIYEKLDFDWLQSNLNLMNIVQEQKSKKGIFFEFLNK